MRRPNSARIRSSGIVLKSHVGLYCMESPDGLAYVPSREGTIPPRTACPRIGRDGDRD